MVQKGNLSSFKRLCTDHHLKTLLNCYFKSLNSNTQTAKCCLNNTRTHKLVLRSQKSGMPSKEFLHLSILKQRKNQSDVEFK